MKRTGIARLGCRKSYVDAIAAQGKTITISGWGYLSDADGQVMVDTDLSIAWSKMKRVPRPDVVSALNDPSLQNAGIELRLTLRDATGDRASHRLCVWTEDRKFGRRMLRVPPASAGSPALVCDGSR